MEEIEIRNVEEKDADVLTKIAFAAKSYWNYPKEYMNLWRNELTITNEYIKSNIVRCAVYENKVIGFYSLVEMKESKYFGKVFVEKGYWLDHMFIIPEYHRKGVGTQFFDDIDKLKLKTDSIKIFVDPYAEEFYKKMSAKKIRISESSIPNRNIPVYEYKIKN